MSSSIKVRVRAKFKVKVRAKAATGCTTTGTTHTNRTACRASKQRMPAYLNLLACLPVSPSTSLSPPFHSAVTRRDSRHQQPAIARRRRLGSSSFITFS
jgi:hypothetical protein